MVVALVGIISQIFMKRKMSYNRSLVVNIQKIDSRNKFLTPEYMEKDTSFIQIDQVFLEIMQIIFLPLGGSS